MAALFEAFSVALCLTSVFAFRYRAWRRPRLVLGYFLLFGSLEGVAHYYWLPPEAIVPATSIVCLALGAVFIGVAYLVDRLERAAGQIDP